jgi:hypothetical protein
LLQDAVGPQARREPEQTVRLIVSPNPAQAGAALLVTGFGSRPFELRMYDILGREVLHSNVGASGIVKLNNAVPAAGVYFLSATNARTRAIATIRIVH